MDDFSQNLTKRERRELRHQEKQGAQRRLDRKKTGERVLVWLIVLIVIIGAIFGLVKLAGNSRSNRVTKLGNAISASDWTLGNKQAKTILVEYSDFQCPACGLYYPLVKQLLQAEGDKIQFAYRHFPLREIHANAELAAEAAEAAGRQGKFWEMYDFLFENQKDWSEVNNARDFFIKYAESLNLNPDQFKTDLKSKEVSDRVENDYQSGLESGVEATPTFFLNGVKIENPRSYDEFKRIIDQASQNP